jgi:hypothetical protein
MVGAADGNTRGTEDQPSESERRLTAPSWSSRARIA